MRRALAIPWSSPCSIPPVEYLDTLESSNSENARTEGDIVFTERNHCGQRHDQVRRILIIRVQHDDDIRTTPQRFAIASFLVAPVAKVLAMYKSGEAQFSGDFCGRITATVVDQNDLVDKVLGDFAISLFERFCGVIGRHYDKNAFSIQHKRAT